MIFLTNSVRPSDIHPERPCNEVFSHFITVNVKTLAIASVAIYTRWAPSLTSLIGSSTVSAHSATAALASLRFTYPSPGYSYIMSLLQLFPLSGTYHIRMATCVAPSLPCVVKSHLSQRPALSLSLPHLWHSSKCALFILSTFLVLITF